MWSDWLMCISGLFLELCVFVKLKTQEKRLPFKGSVHKKKRHFVWGGQWWALLAGFIYWGCQCHVLFAGVLSLPPPPHFSLKLAMHGFRFFHFSYPAKLKKTGPIFPSTWADSGTPPAIRMHWSSKPFPTNRFMRSQTIDWLHVREQLYMDQIFPASSTAEVLYLLSICFVVVIS